MTLILILLGLTLGLFAGITEAKAEATSGPYCQAIDRLDQSERIENIASIKKADYILISKDRRKLYLLSEGRVVSEYGVSFGFGAKDGAKFKDGDGRTPEGIYSVAFKNSDSKYHLALKLSYPNQNDILNAEKLNVNPGSNIMIHGLPSGLVDDLIPSLIQKVHTFVDWTQGCIAVTDHEIEEIFSLVQEGIPVEICGLSRP